MSNRLARIVAAALGFFGVLLGAFGAHALRSRLGQAQVGYWETGVLYQLVHAAVLLCLSGWRPVPRLSFLLMAGGVVAFSGSLYLLALTNERWWGAITPLGGFGFLFGWLALAWVKE